MIAEVPAPPAGNIKTERDPNDETDVRPNDVALSDIPTKCIKYVQKLEVLCKVAFIDFEGRSDGESIKVY